MSIHRFFTNSVVIRRLAATGNQYTRSFVATGTIDVHIQRIDESTSPAEFGVYGATHKLWCDISRDIKDGDRVFDSQNNEYEVVAVINQGMDIANNEHKQVMLRLYVPQELRRE